MDNLAASKLFGVHGMVFVITGGGSGLGETMALALDANGASKVFIMGRRMASMERVAAKAINQTVVPIVCDITSKEELQAAVTTIEGQTRFVNAVVANSGALGPITATGPRADDETIDSIYEQFWNTSMTQSQEVLNINVLGSFFTFVAFMKLLEAGNTHPESRGKTDFIQSQFITITSLSGLGRRENVGHAYMASKAALVHLTKSLATIFGPRGIRANSIAPGIYLTEMTEFYFGGADPSIPGSLPKAQYPMTRAGNAEDIAGAILFLTSRAGAYVNGNILLSDGGAVGNEPSTY